MKRQQAFQYEMRPKGWQTQRLHGFAGSCRYVFNRALALQQERRQQGHKRIGYADLCRLLTGWRGNRETAWLAQAPVHPLQQSLKDLDRAWISFFAKRSRPPRFKKKGRWESFRYPDPKQIRLDERNARLFLPKLGWVRYRKSRKVQGEVKQVTVSQRCGKWFVAIQTEREVEPPVRQGGSVGIDLGIVRFATLSDGSRYAPLHSFKRHQAALRKAQQALSRKRRFSSNWKEAKARVQRLHARIVQALRDYLHKLTTTLSKNHALVCLEDLKVRTMSRTAAGSVERPGTRVRAKSALNRSILDQGWYEFRRQLAYKLAWSGGQLVVVPPHNTSRTCPDCGHVSKQNRPTQNRFECVCCGLKQNADRVAAINILRAGHARFACEVSGAAMPPAAGTRRSVSLGHTA